MSSLSRLLRIVSITVIMLGLGFIVTLFVVRRMRTGEWAIPDGDDLIHIQRGFTGGGEP